MMGYIVEIKETAAKVDIGECITDYLPFLYVPIKNQIPVFDYAVGDQVLIAVVGGLDQGAILGVVK